MIGRRDLIGLFGGAAVLPTDCELYGRFIPDEVDKWAKVIRAVSITAE